MSKFTTTLRDIIESYNEWNLKIPINERIENARLIIFDFEYDIDNNYKKILETKIIKHYFTHEIGFETVDLFMFRLEALLQEIAPTYKELYKTIALNINPLYNYTMEENYQRTNKGNVISDTLSKADNDSNSKTIRYDTPDGQMEIPQNYASAIETTESKNNSNVSDNVKTDNNNIEDYIRNVSGNIGTPYGTLLNDYRSAIINIDTMIINELGQLFMGIF